MALPATQDSRTFKKDQSIDFEALYWDTPYAAKSGGLGFALFDILNGEDFDASAESNPESVISDTNITRSALGYEAGSYREGVVPLMYDYWGAGAPVGGKKAQNVAMKFTGYAKFTGTVTLIFGGSGYVKADVSGSSVSGTVREPNTEVDESLVDMNDFLSAAGYQILTANVTKGDQLTVYYWHRGERWGGFFGKILPYDLSAAYDGGTVRQDIRVAPPIAASSFGIESSGDDLDSDPIPYLLEARVNYDVGGIPRLEMDVPLALADDDTGYRWDKTSKGLINNEDSPSLPSIDLGRRVQFLAGFDGELYSRFVGSVVDITPDTSTGVATILCDTFEHLLDDSFDENYPDRTSYHANGFVRREGSADPVWGVPAFDNWPLESAVAEMMYRAGVDPYVLGKSPVSADPDHGRREQIALDGESKRTEKFFSVRGLSDKSNEVQLERNAAYGNVGVLKKDYLPDDEEYLFPPEPSARIMDRVRELVEHMGYDFGFNPLGQAYIAARNNANDFIHGIDVDDSDAEVTVTTSGISSPGDRDVSPSAIGGRYLKKATGDVWSYEVDGYMSRLDVYVGIGRERLDTDGSGPATGDNGAVVDVQVERWDGSSWTTVANDDFSTYHDGDESFYYDNVTRTDGTNGAVFTVMQEEFGRYRVTLTPGGQDPEDGNASAWYRVDGVGVFYRDPLASPFTTQFTTAENALDVKFESAGQDQRNHVIVVGARKASVTDSTKLANEDNPNNPGREFHVSVAADPYSIYDPTAPNFVGTKRVSVIIDDKVADSDFARWLARTILFRYRQPKGRVPITHTAVPTLELRDPLYAVEEAQETVDGTVWTSAYRETWKPSEATVEIEAEAYPEIPSYRPREDIPIDELFDHDGDGKGEHAINVAISYKNLYGDTVGNSDLTTNGDESFEPLKASRTAVQASDPITLTGPVCPETIALIGKNTTGDERAMPHDRTLVNHPYRHFWDISSWSSGDPTLSFDFQEGNGSTVYSKSYYDFPSGTDYQWYVTYFQLQSRGGPNPFYDPYSSELGHLVSISFDALVGGFYRVSIWDAREGGGRSTPVAWLTNPQEDSEDPEAHWSYHDPQANLEFTWDGVDNIGFWNRIQSGDSYSEEIEGSFGDSPTRVGKGFYAWNDESTDLHTQIGDDRLDNYQSGGREDGYPYFTVGKYGQFYVRIEVLNDELMLKDGGRIPRVVRSDDLADPFNSTVDTFIWTHLGEPSQVAVTISDWDEAQGDWTVADGVDGTWTTEDASASIRKGKPVKLSFSPRGRRGPLFDKDPEKVSIKLTRQVHLKTTVFDQFWTFFGRTWQGLAEQDTYPEEKRVTSRMYHNEDHTLEWEDDTWRTGLELTQYEWVFDPSMFEKDFGLGLEEELRYGDYEQLESLPGFQPRQSGGAVREDNAFLTLAFMNYLFYMSAFTIDRSGRRQWCLNRNFVDNSKIVTGTWNTPVDYNRHSAERYLKRSIFVRQWVEPGWDDGSIDRSPASSQHSVTGGGLTAYEASWVQPAVTDFDALSTSISGGTTDRWAQAYKETGSDVNKDLRFQVSEDSPTLPSAWSTDTAISSIGSWDFRRGGQSADWFFPSPCRDFHPYWRVPLMPDWAATTTAWYNPSESTGIQNQYVHILAGAGSQVIHSLRDIAPRDTWSGRAFQRDQSFTVPSMRGARLEQTVQAWAGEQTQPNSLLEYIYDYQRQDSTDRFDQFRGVKSRGAFEDRNRDENIGYFTNPDDGSRTGSQQATKPSGVYLLNSARYGEYILAPANYHKPRYPLHWVPKVTDWYDFRFRSEYVWMNDRHFPVDGKGFNLYGYYRDELTNVRGSDDVSDTHKVPKLWYQTVPDRENVYYDSGAWTGWKDDKGAGALSWREHSRKGNLKPSDEIVDWFGRNEGTPDYPWPAEFSGTASFQGEEPNYFEANIFDAGKGEYGGMRLAVGPEVPESTGLIMNLVLPPRLKG